MNKTQAAKIDILGTKIGEAALNTLIRLYPDVRKATSAQIDAAMIAMRAKTPEVLDRLFEDTEGAPWLAHIALQTAALTLAHEAIKSLKAA
ncbi:HDOD domain-containing protein [Gammaproteobacteria bacterium]